jgi:hypothetical protein
VTKSDTLIVVNVRKRLVEAFDRARGVQSRSSFIRPAFEQAIEQGVRPSRGAPRDADANGSTGARTRTAYMRGVTLYVGSRKDALFGAAKRSGRSLSRLAALLMIETVRRERERALRATAPEQPRRTKP